MEFEPFKIYSSIARPVALCDDEKGGQTMFTVKEGEPLVVSPQHYYRHPSVQQRIAEYCGGQAADPESFTAEYLSGIGEAFKLDRVTEEYFFSATRDVFCGLFDRGVDIFRSVWDRTSTVGILDTEYFNRIFPGEAYFKPHRTFGLTEPVYWRILNLFARFGIPVLTILTGQGYHFGFRVDFSSRTHAHLISIGKLEKSLITKYNSAEGRLTPQVSLPVGRAFDGVGRLLEYLCHILLRELGGRYKGIPVVCTDLAVPDSPEALALDLSMYGDPIYMRDVRCPFSTYQKHKYQQAKFGPRAAEEVPVFVTLPRLNGFTIDQLLSLRKDFARSQEYAAEVETKIPEASFGVQRLIKSYRASKLFEFHTYFDTAEHDDPSAWPSTYDKFDLGKLPPCVAHSLAVPNDNLLKPTNLQALTRVLMKNGWHPKHIAGLIRSKFERDYGWGGLWAKYDAATRANFYVRLFAGLVYTGVDKEDDLDCTAHAQKGFCWSPDCGHSLADYRL